MKVQVKARNWETGQIDIIPFEIDTTTNQFFQAMAIVRREQGGGEELIRRTVNWLAFKKAEAFDWKPLEIVS